MRVFLLGLLLFIFPKEVFAGESPNLLNPVDGSIVSSSALTWQAPTYTLYPTNPYRVQVDDDLSFSSLNKDYYTDNTYYTPVLTDGTWFWRVKAKDISGQWSNWSEVRSFILTTSSSPTPSPTSLPSPSISPSPSSSGTQTSSFTISGLPSEINSDQSFSVSVNFTSPDHPNTIFYLKGAFKKAGSSNYFGLTKVSDNWVKNGKLYSDQYKITTNSEGNWSGNIEVKPDSEDSGFSGTGDYILKVARYTSSGSGPTWSNEGTINIISTQASSQDSTPTNTPSTSKTPTFPPPVKTKTTSSNRSSSYDTLVYRNASIAAATTSANSSSTPSAEIKFSKQKQVNIFVWLGLGFIFAGSSSLGYIYLKKSGKIHF